MTALELLADMTRRQLDSFFEAVRAIPADKLDWQPSPGSRSALDQVQEVATVFAGIPKAVTERKLEFTPEAFAQMVADRKKVTDLAELEKMTREGTEKLIEFILSVPASELQDTVAMPWPGDYRVASLLGYHNWNMAYHEGQINYIGTLLAAS
jgi:uncharacterized damage-inducible protein DinB